MQEIKLKENCEYDDFYKIASLLEHELGATLIERIDDFDSLYWHFRIDGVGLILHYNIYEGIDLYSDEGKEASNKAKDVVMSIGNKLLTYL